MKIDYFYAGLKKAHLNNFVYRSISPLFQAETKMGAMQARKLIEEYLVRDNSRREDTAIAAHHFISPPKFDLQIIVPCYNVEDYVEECIESILNQNTKYSIIVQLINDGSSDNTLEILSRYRNVSRIEIIDKPNGGLSDARNAGLKSIAAKYIMFVDSDDILDGDSIDALMDRAMETDADLVQGGFSRYIDGKITPLQEYRDGRIESVDIFGYPWGKVYRATLFENLQFPVGYWFEDTMNHFLLHTENVIAYSVARNVYNYRYNPTSITSIAYNHPKSLDSFRVTELLFYDMKRLNFTFDRYLLDKVLRQFIMNSQRIMNMSNDTQKAVFVLQCGLLKKFFSNNVDSSHEFKDLLNICRNYNYARYRLYLLLK